MSSSFGKIFRVSTFGESHGGAVGVILDGCPPKLKVDINLIQNELDRRRPGQSDITTPRNEEDKIEILSGIKEGLTLGTPIAMLVRNKDQRPGDYIIWSRYLDLLMQMVHITSNMEFRQVLAVEERLQEKQLGE